MQTELFQGRTSGAPRSVAGHFVSTTWMYRCALMDDIKLRAACPRLPRELLPSRCFGPQPDLRIVADDETTWIIGSRGNSVAILRQEALGHPELWPEEKHELLTWLDGPRKLEEGALLGASSDLVRDADSYYIEQIRSRDPDLTEEEIRASGLPERTIESLITNWRGYRRNHEL